MSQYDSGSPLDGAGDSSLELVMAASASQSASRPRYLIVGAVALLLVAIGYLVWVIAAQGAAARQLGKARTNLDNLKVSVEQVKSVYSKERRELYEPNSRVISSLTTSAEQSGLPGVVPSSAADIRNVKGYVIKQYNVNVVEKDPTVLLSWLAKVTNDQEIPGLDLYRVKFTPGYKIPGTDTIGWNMEATFRRWQRDN
ncbi:MAG: hypothetical protein AB7G11_10670 [Phycisphaerales bacterium]